MSTLTIIILVVVGIIILPILWNIAKGLFKFAILVLIVLGAIYLFSPETIDGWFGAENVEKVEIGVKEAGKKVGAELDTLAVEINEEIEKSDSIKKAKEKLDSLANK